MYDKQAHIFVEGAFRCSCAPYTFKKHFGAHEEHLSIQFLMTALKIDMSLAGRSKIYASICVVCRFSDHHAPKPDTLSILDTAKKNVRVTKLVSHT